MIVMNRLATNGTISTGATNATDLFYVPSGGGKALEALMEAD
jgi:hypothetical protein